jgi:glycine cleavage system transcriptional repressor
MSANPLQHVVISGYGHDRPGIVAGLTQVLLAHDCNIEDTRMTILGGEFAVILLASAPQTLVCDTLQQALNGLQQTLGFSATVKLLNPQRLASQHGQLYLMRVSGRDRTGITYHATQLLAQRGLGITDLQAHRIDGDAGPAYLLLIEFLLLDTAQLPALHQALLDLNTALEVESHLVPVDTGVL